MFVAMNRFRVRRGSEEEFEQVWRDRESQLDQVPGFLAFHLLRGAAQSDHTLYASHSLWRSRDDFEAWTRSEAFRRAHRNAGDNKHLYMESPVFEGFDTVLAQRAHLASP